MTEYIKLSHQEKIYGHRFLLQSQIEMMNILRSIKEYKILRKKEFILKVALNAKIGEALAEIGVLQRTLPRVSSHEEKKPLFEIQKHKEENLTLEQEIDLIRQKLSKLQE